MHPLDCVRLALVLVALTPAILCQEEEPPHYKREPFHVPGMPGTVAQFSLSSDAHLDAVAVRLGAGDRRVLAILNDGRGLEGNWSSPVVISNSTSVARSLDENSCQVFEDRAFVTWLDDRDGSAATRVHFNRYDQTSDAWLSGPVEIDDSTYPSGSDVTDFQMVVKRGTSGSPYVIVLTTLRAAAKDFVYLSVSPDAGSTFNAPVKVTSPPGSPGDVGDIACDMRFGELHLAWTDDRAGTMDVYHRLALLSFFGVPQFFAPESAISTGAGTRAVGPLVLQTNAENGWTGSDQKYVGVAYLQDDGDGTTNLHVLTSRNNGSSFSDVLIDQTAASGTEVESFDFEIPGDTFTVVWQDDNDGTQQVYRSDSDDGLAFTTPLKTSGFEDATNVGFSPRISPSFGTPDGACIVFLEEGDSGLEVLTNFSDQAFGGEWHSEEYPRVSEAQGEPPARDVQDPDVAYNELYYNYLVGWREETAPGSGVYDLVLGGYRPPQVELEVSSNAMRFGLFHVPFQNTFGFVMLSLSPPTSGTGTLLYDGRSTGLVSDSLTTLWLTSHWQFAIFENDSAGEGGQTQFFPLPPMASALDVTFLYASWGPFGELRTLSEPFTDTIPPTPFRKILPR
jgi:hypothetical protein